jgi:dihydroflavonol-4-reductase
MTVFVTGGNGFVGSAVIRRLIEHGHSVRCLIRDGSDTSRISALPWDRVIGDVRDPRAVGRGMAGADGVIHLASPSSWNEIDSPLMQEVGVGGTRVVLDAARAAGNVRVVFVSSIVAINGSATARVFTEDDQWTLAARGLTYAHAKRAAEALCAEYAAAGVPVVTVNPGEIYGPADTRFITAGNLVDFATSNPVLVCTGGTSVIHVDDAAAGIVAALTHGRPGRRYILGGDNLSIRQLAQLTLDLLGLKTRIVAVPNALLRAVSSLALRLRLPLPFNPRVVPYATRFWFGDNTRARRELGVTFRSARETLAPVIDWLKRERHI